MDAKGRLAMPARQREPLLNEYNGHLVITVDTQTRCLVIYPLPEWEKIEREIQDLPALKPAVKRFQRLVIDYATELELDRSGRVLLPASLREYASLEKKLVLVGQGKKMELWAEQLWLAERERALQESASETDLPEELMSLTL